MSQALLVKAPGNEPRPVKRRLAFAFGGPAISDPDAPRTLSEALARTARLFPERGIRFISPGEERIESYASLWQRALRVAAGLRKNGLLPGDRVVLQLDSLRSHFTAFWGCVLAGGAPVTVAISPTYKERNGVVNKLFNTWTLLGEPMILTTTRLASSLAGLEALVPMKNLRIVRLEDLIQHEPIETIHPAEPNDVAFLQLSSGSTGVPKCIQETHAGILAHIYAARSFNHYGQNEVTLNWLPVDHVVPILTFHLRDVSLGYQQIQADPGVVLSEPLAWLNLIQEHRVTQTWAPNFGFKLVSDRLRRAPELSWDLSSVKFFMNAGEQVTMPVLRSFLDAVAPFGVQQSAMQPAFGMAEVCTCMTYANQFNLKTGARRFLKSSLDAQLQLTEKTTGESVEFVSLGGPVPGVSIRITDSVNRLVPEGVIGRLQIKGPVVTPGYLNNPEANAEAFVGGGWFNSGDLGFIQDGELFLTGREKEMIIVRGSKYYCYELEDVVSQVSGVEPTFAAACSIADPAAGTEQLAIFFVTEPSADPAQVAQEVRSTVSSRMGLAPRFVLPLTKSEFPKTTSGKIQRTQLKKGLESGAYDQLLQQINRSPAPPVATGPLTGTETRIATIWAEVLAESQIPVDCSLFSAGGDSLKAIQIISRLRDAFRLEFPLAMLFEEDATIRKMAAWIDSPRDQGHGAALPPIARRNASPEAPASWSQLRIWIGDQIQPGTALYNICRAVRLDGPLDCPALERALDALVRRHEILRTVFTFDGALKQRILPEAPSLQTDDLRSLPATERNWQTQKLIQAEANRGFDLNQGPLFRARLLLLSPEENVLLVTFHQIVVDGWSIPIFYRELAELYEAAAEGRDSRLPDLPIQYADFASWQQQWMTDAHLAEQFNYWRAHPARNQTELQFSRLHQPADVDTAPVGRTGQTVQVLRLDQPLVEALREFNSREGNTLFVTLLTAFQFLLHRWSGGEEIVVGSPAAGRTRLETEGLIGFFVNTLLLRTQIPRGGTFRDLSRQVRQTASGAFAHSEAPFERVIQRHARSSGAPQRWFQFWFAPIDPQIPFVVGKVKATPQIVFPNGAQFDLSLFISESPGELLCYFEYQPGVLKEHQVARFVTEYEALLRQVIVKPGLPIAPESGAGVMAPLH